MRRVHWSVAFLMLSAAGLHAQTVTTTVGGRNGPQALPAPEAGQSGLVTLRGNMRPEANAKNDRGRVSDDMILNHMMLQLRRSPEREQALQQFINDIHDHTSPLFHHWITATEFGQRYGVAPADVAKVTDWLESQGFKVNLVYPNQMVIDFTGSAGQIRQAFHTEIHHLLVNGQAHIANMSDPQIPAEFASTVAGIVSLNDFRPQPMIRRRADYTSASGNYPVVPADLWTIYNFNPAFASGISGQGQTIVVVEDSDLYTTQDWSNYRSTLGLASAYPLGSLTQVNPGNCTDPGAVTSDDEATLDVEMATAGAPSAAIELASCADTETTPGFLIALQNLVNTGGTPPAIVSMSYGFSESGLGAAFNASISSTYEQAVTEGVSVFVSSGDHGAASSDAVFGEEYAENGISVSGFTSTPYNVSVGGTDFADTYEETNTTYWSATNSANGGSALSYIPEIPWNDSCASVLLGDILDLLPTYGSAGLCNNSLVEVYDLLNTAAGSGGPSGCATGAPDIPGLVSGSCAGYLKPSWQSGFIGNPNDGVRDIPDVSLFASDGSVWAQYYAVCFSDPSNGGMSCSGTPDTWFGAGGTSASTPLWAAIQSLVNQASGSRWGNPDSEYYSRATTEYGAGESCDSNSALNNTLASNCIFYDVTQIPLIYGGSGTGGDIDLPCSGMNCYLPSGTYGVLSTAPQTLSGAFVTNLGSGYTSAPSCTLGGGGGSGAACSGITTGVVTSVGLVNGGTGYTSQPSCTLTGGGGTGAGCEVTQATTGGVLTGIVLTAYGSGYTSAPTCTISGGDGIDATCTTTEGLGIAVSLTVAGSGYTSLPGCVLSGGGGTGGTCAAQAVNTSGAYQPAFGATTGWDFATGIGTVNVSNLVASFPSSSGAAVSLSASSLSFSNQPTSTTSPAQTETVTNSGTVNLSISTATISGTNASDFAKSADTCTGATVTPNSTCTVSVTFTPSSAGSLSASLDFTDNASGSPQTVILTGTGVGAAPVAGVSPSSVTFSNQNVGTTSASQSITLSNTGNAALNISTVTISGTNSSDFAKSADTCTGAAVAPNNTCTVSVTFTPSATGSRSASLNFTDNAGGSPQTVGLSGTGTGPVVSLSAPPTFPSEPVGTTSPSQTVTLTNSGSASLTFTAIGVTGPFATVASGTTCSTSSPVAAAGSCTVAVTFTPTAAGTASGSLSFSDNAAGTPQTIALSGTGQDFTLAAGSGSPTSATVAPGSTASYTLSVGGVGGFNQSVSFTCTGAPSEATCTVSPSPVTPGSSATNITVSVTTTAPSVGAPRSRPLPPVPPLLPGLRGLLILALVLLAMTWAIGRRNIPVGSRWRTTMVSLASGLLLALALAGCGGGGSSVTHNSGTPAGTYTLTVTGSAGSGSSSVSHTMTLTLTVS
jgi:hypothetical protein